MEKKRSLLTSPITTVALFAAAAVLLLVSTIGGARAALTYFSQNYTSQVELYDIGVTLVENGSDVSWRNYGSQADGTWVEATGELLTGMVPEGEKFHIGQTYPEAIAVKNSGTIDEYTRVSIYKYWVDAEGKKDQTLSPDLIELNYINLDSDWILDTAASTQERTVLYYNKILPTGETTPALSDTLTISGFVATKVTQETHKEDEEGNVNETGPYTVITTTYDYDGYRFEVKAVVDAVQTHNATDAIWSAWGRHVNIEDGVITSLVNE